MKTFTWHDIINSLDSPTAVPFFKEGSGISVGSFDGVHLGHKELISTLVKKCKENGVVPGVVTFSRPLPAIKKSSEYEGDICSLEERLRLLEELGVKFAIVVDFDSDFAARSGNEFFDILIKVCNLKVLCEGVDFRCGYKGAFNKDLILSYCTEHGLEVSFVEPVFFNLDGNKVRISSSIIRSLIKKNDFKSAEMMLGHSY